MERRGPPFGYVIALAAIGVILAAVIFQVDQPIRGYVVAFLLVSLTAGSFVLRLVGHLYEYKVMRLSMSGGEPPGKRRQHRERPASSLNHLRVIHASRGKHRRNVIR